MATSPLSLIEPGDPGWRAYVESQADALPFHHPAWLDVLARTYGYRAFVLGRVAPSGAIAGGLPVMEVAGPLRTRRRWISLPFTDYCPPLGGDGAELAGLLDDARARAGVAALELRAELGGGVTHETAGAVRHVLPLHEDAAAVFRTFKKSQVQRNIKKAQRSGVVVRRATSAADLTGAFYGLHLMTRRRLGVPIQPRRFFANLWERVIEPGLGFVLLAEADDRPVAGAVFLAWQGTVIYKYGASDASAWSLRPNNALFWDAIQWSCESGQRSFDFGRTELEDTGLRDFKSGWGTEELPLVYTTLADRPSRARPGGRALASVIRRSPPWTCRALGEVLYKYAA